MIQHFLSLPIFLFLIPDIKRGLTSLSAAPAYTPYLILATNLVTQLICVSSVNQLTSVSFIFLLCLPTHPQHQKVSSVSTNLVLTTRKALSLCLSVWYFGKGWNWHLCVGAGMVFVGSFLFSQTPDLQR